MKLTDEIEKLAEKLHIWYLEATKELSPESYNPDAQKEYKDLTEEQKFIDRYIAQAITKHIVEMLPKEKDVWLDKHTGEPFSKNGFNNNGRTFVKDEKAEYYNQCISDMKEKMGL